MSENRLDLAILIHDLSATGVARNAIRIASAMAERGLAVEIWRVREGGKFEAQVPGGVKLRCFAPSLRLPLRRLEILAAVPALARAVKQFRPRVLFSAGNHFHWAVGAIFRRAGSPPETRLMGRASNAPPRLAMPVLGRIAARLDARKYSALETVIAVSLELGEMLHARSGLPKDKIACIPNGIDLEAIARAAAEPLEDPWFAAGSPPVIISAGRLSRQKNYPLLIEAFSILRKGRPAHLIILGEGPEKARQSLLALAQTRGVAEDVRLHGFEANPARYFARSGVFVLSSLWEGLSNVVLEALATGCPVVATDCPTGIREQLDNGRLGPIVPLNDPQALAAAMLQRLDAPRNSESLEAQAARFSLKDAMEAYFRLISSAKTHGR